MREVRERIRAVVARVADDNPLVIMQHGVPAAVLLRFDEAERWSRIERGLAALHALDVYPELVSGTAQLGAAVRGELKPTRAAIRRLDEEPREILGPLQTVQITDLRERLATNLEEVANGRALTVVSSGRFAATLISPREFDRLRTLHRAVVVVRGGRTRSGLGRRGRDRRASSATTAAGPGRSRPSADGRRPR